MGTGRASGTLILWIDTALASSDERHDFEPIPLAEYVFGVPCPRNEFQVDLDRHGSGGEIQLLKKNGD